MRRNDNVIPAEEWRAASKLVDFSTWLENNRDHFKSILRRGQGSPGYATVLAELQNQQHELYQWLLWLPK